MIPHAYYFSAKVVDDWAELRGMENVYTDMMDEPEWTHEAFQRITNNFEKRFKTLESLGVWGPWQGSEPMGSNGLRFNPDIPDYKSCMQKGRQLLSESWGSSCAEGFNCVSPLMHEEFALILCAYEVFNGS